MNKNLIPAENVTDEIFKPFFTRPAEPKEKIITADRGTYHPRNTLNHLTGKEWIHFSRSWFNHRPKPRNKNLKEDAMRLMLPTFIYRTANGREQCFLKSRIKLVCQ